MLLQVLAQQIPPINVTVQQPAGAIPAWVVALIGAGTGALLGILSSASMEYIKSWIINRRLRRQTESHLIAEVRQLLRIAKECREKYEKIEPQTPTDYAAASTQAFVDLVYATSDRYDLYFEEQRELVYDLDPNKYLADFHQFLKGTRTAASDGHYDQFRGLLKSTVEIGGQYLAAKPISE